MTANETDPATGTRSTRPEAPPDLIAPDTVNTMPEKTLRSYADHGSPGQPIQRTYDEARRS